MVNGIEFLTKRWTGRQITLDAIFEKFEQSW